MLPSGLGVEDLALGAGPVAQAGDRVIVHFVGRLSDDRIFESTRDEGEPFVLELGAGRAIRGFDEGIVGMRVGGTRRLIVPPSLGYGSRGSPPEIPPDAMLEFHVELLDVERP